jgi:hypothetical protein
MARRQLFSKYFLDPAHAKAKLIISPIDDGGGGGGGGGGPAGVTPAPIITSVIADKSQLTIGGFVKFTVNITNSYSSCLITGNGIASPGLSVTNGVQSSAISPTSTGTLTYTITAINAAIASPNSSAMTKEISVLTLPQISAFTATVSGNNVLLVPTFTPSSGTIAKIVYGTTTINNVVSGTTYTVAKPIVETVYTLEVKNEAGYGDQRTATVTASALNPTISGFTSSSQTVDASTNFTITPTFTNGTGVITRSKLPAFTGSGVSNGGLSIACSTGVAITTQITETTTFTLRVTAA